MCDAAQVGDMAAMVGARSRWVVTGTPIGSGGLTDLHGLLRVLQHDPFQDRQLWRTCIARPYAQGNPTLPLLRARSYLLPSGYLAPQRCMQHVCRTTNSKPV